jgi:hypothetical protein
MRRIEIAELRNLDDATIKEMGLRVQSARSGVLAVANSLLRQHDGIKSPTVVIVSVGVLHRMAECALSIELLASKGFLRDAATLILTLMELRLDLQYMARVRGRDVEWLSHAAQSRKPWPVHREIEELYPDDNERDAELANYRTFSTIKHANPAGGNAAFPLSPLGEGLGVRDPGEAARLMPVYLYAVGSNLCQSVTAVAGMADAADFDISDHVRHFEDIRAQLAHVLGTHMRVLVAGYLHGRSGLPAAMLDDV